VAISTFYGARSCRLDRISNPASSMRFTAGLWALDQEPEMIEAGRREASRLGITNVRSRVGRAEAFNTPAAAFDLVAIGEAFHRLNPPHVARLAFAWLKPGGALVTLGFGISEEAAPWRPIVATVVREFIGEPARRLGASNTTLAAELANQERDIREAGFVNVATHSFAVPHDWTLETLLGNARLTLTLSRAALGRRHPDFRRRPGEGAAGLRLLRLISRKNQLRVNVRAASVMPMRVSPPRGPTSRLVGADRFLDFRFGSTAAVWGEARKSQPLGVKRSIERHSRSRPLSCRAHSARTPLTYDAGLALNDLRRRTRRTRPVKDGIGGSIATLPSPIVMIADMGPVIGRLFRRGVTA